MEGQQKGNQVEFGVPFQAMCFHLVFDVIYLSMVESPARRCGVDFGWIVLPLLYSPARSALLT